MKVTNVKALQELIFNEYVKPVDLGFTATGADIYPVMQDVITGDVYIKHTENSYYMYNSIEECKKEYIKLGYQISYDLTN